MGVESGGSVKEEKGGGYLHFCMHAWRSTKHSVERLWLMRINGLVIAECMARNENWS